MTTTTRATAPPVRGLVRRPASIDVFRTARFPAGSLAPWVEHVWTLDWDLRGAAPVESTVISFPSMHVTAEWGDEGERRHGHPMPATLVHGLVSRVFRIRLVGRGGVVGARFRPGAFALWAGVDASRLTDRVMGAASVLGAGASDLHAGCRDLEPEARAERFAAALHAVRHGRDLAPRSHDGVLADLVRRMADDPTLVRVEQLAEVTGWSVRTLQRRFRSEVGIGPKWVLARFRLQEAALALEQDPDVDLATLAARLGWYDQAHLTGDFRRMLGETPGAYAARSLAGPG